MPAITYVSLMADSIRDRLDIGTLKAVPMGNETTEIAHKSLSFILANSIRIFLIAGLFFQLDLYEAIQGYRRTPGPNPIVVLAGAA